jgi:hypothetical protein
MKSPDTLTHAIDAVGRRMTERNSADMRARVMAELRPRRSPRPMFWTIGGLAAAGVALAFVMTRPARVPQEPGFGARGSALARTETRMPNAEPRGPRAETRNPNSEPRMPSAETRDPSVDELAWQAAALPPLDRPELLALENIQPDELEVRPLTMAPLDIPLLGAEED